MKRLAILISGQGRNLQAILDASAAEKLPAQIVCVVSNRAAAGGLDRAREAGVATEVVSHTSYLDRERFDRALAVTLERHKPDIVALAGFMRVLGPEFIRTFSGRMVNIHPSLLPRHRGLHTHRRVLADKDAEHGGSVHFVTEELDGGPVAIQGRFSVRPQDTEQTLAERVMRDVEVKVYPQALAWMARGELALERGSVMFRGKRLAAPLSLDDLETEFR